MKSLTVAALATLLAFACGERKPEQAAGMSGMMMKSDSLMPIMRTHLDSLGAIPGASLPGMVAAHEAMASQMLDAMAATCE